MANVHLFTRDGSYATIVIYTTVPSVNNPKVNLCPDK